MKAETLNQRLILNFWKRTNSGAQDVDLDSTWDEEVNHLNELGISMEPTLHFIFHEAQRFDDFQHWISNKQTVSPEQKSDVLEDVLCAEDLDFFNKNGYLVLKGAVSNADCEDCSNAIWEFLQANPENSETWYAPHPGKSGMMLHFFEDPCLEKNRNSLRIKKAYEQLYGSSALSKTIDKVSFNPPEHQYHPFVGSDLHWDVSLAQPIPFKLQGLLYLSDCGERDGAFHCVPGFHLEIEAWLKQVPEGIAPREWALKDLKPRLKAIAGNAGDFIIWHQALPHCATANRGQKPRMVQYLTYVPKNYQAQNQWI